MKKTLLLSTLSSLLIFCNPFGYAQSIGVSGTGSVPDVSALLDIDASGMASPKGLLIPRVALTSVTDKTTIATPATSLLVYNTTASGTSPNNVTPGYYYNAGTTVAANWLRFEASNANSSGNIQTFTATAGNPYTWTKPSTGTVALIQCWGGGGSGGKDNGGSPNLSGGGGGGSYIECWMPLASLGATESITIGIGGAAISGASNCGNPGNNTTFGSGATLLTAYGGGGGNTTSCSATTGSGGSPGLSNGGNGGFGTSGGYSLFGGAGGGGYDSNFAQAWGGGTVQAYGGVGGSGGTTGVAGTQPGGGGGGSTSGNSGKGGAGKCVVIVY